MLLLVASFVSAASTLTSLNLQGTPGETVQGVVVLTHNNDTNPLTQLTVTSLASGSNVISSNNIVIESVPVLQDSLQAKWNVTVLIPANQVAGVYTGILNAYVSGNLDAQSIFTLTVDSTVNPGASFTISDIDFGGSSQTREETINSNIRIVNTGSESLIISLSSNVPSSYSLTFAQSTVTVLSGQTMDVPVTLYVPDDQDSGRQTIGAVTAIATNAAGLTKTSSVYLQTKSELAITKVRAVIDGRSSTLDDGEDVDAKPGDDVTLTITLKNEFSDSINIEDINVDVLADNDLDWDDSTDISRIQDGDKKEIDFSFNVPNDIDEDNYDVDINVDGTDENGARHEAEYTITINVNRENHEISIDSITLNPTRVSCGGRVTLRTRVENTGSNDEDNVAIAIENAELGLEEYVTRLAIDQGDISDKSVSFDVPSNTPVGEYIIDITTYYDNKESDYNVASLYVDQCGGTTNTTLPPSSGNNGGSGTVPIPPVVYPSGTVGPTYGGVSFFNSTAYVILLVVAVLIFLVLITLLLVKFVF
jgi:hypothetical protein